MNDPPLPEKSSQPSGNQPPAGGHPPTTDTAPPAPTHEFHYDAFISYRHLDPDRQWAKWLHSTLETYRVPQKLRKQRRLPARLKKVFRDEEELPASPDLNKEIEKALKLSQFLIVICSPRTPESEWVNKEVVRFRQMGRGDKILALLIDGEPGQSFPPALREIRRELIDAQGHVRSAVEEIEPLAADVRPSRIDESPRHLKRMARLRILACILGVSFDDLRRRELERFLRRAIAVATGASILLLLLTVLSVLVIRERGRAEHAAVLADIQKKRVALEQERVKREQQRVEQQTALTQQQAALRAEKELTIKMRDYAANVAEELDFLDGKRETGNSALRLFATDLQLNRVENIAGFEWYHIAHKARSGTQQVTFGDIRVNRLEFMDDARLAAVGNRDVEVYNLDTHKQSRIRLLDDNDKDAYVAQLRLRGSSPGFVVVRQTRDDVGVVVGTTFQSWTLDPTIKQASIASLEPQVTYRLSRDGRRLATFASASQMLRIWSLEDGKMLSSANRPGIDRIDSLSSDGMLLAVTVRPTEGMCLLNTETLDERIRLEGTGRDPIFSPDAKWLVLESAQTLQLYEVGTGRKAFDAILCGDHRRHAPMFSPDGQILAFCGRSSRLSLLSLERRSVVETECGFFEWRGGGMNSATDADVAFTGDGKILASGRTLLEVGSGAIAATLPAGGSHLAFAPNGRALAVISGILSASSLTDQSTCIIYGESRWRASSPMNESGQVVGVAFSPDGARAMVHPDRVIITAKDGVPCGPPVILDADINEPYPVALSPRSDYLAVVSDRRLKVFKPDTGKLVWDWSPLRHADVLGNLPAAMTPDGEAVATRCGDELILWEAITGRKIWDRRVTGTVSALCFSRSGRYLAYTVSGPRGSRTASIGVFDRMSNRDLWNVSKKPNEVWPTMQPRFATDESSVWMRVENGFEGQSDRPTHIETWETASGQSSSLSLAPAPDRPLFVQASSDLNYIATVEGPDSSVWVNDRRTQGRRSYGKYRGRVRKMEFSENNDYLAALFDVADEQRGGGISSPYLLTAWDVAAGREIGTAKGGSLRPRIRFSADGCAVSIGSCVLDLRSGKELDPDKATRYWADPVVRTVRIAAGRGGMSLTGFSYGGKLVAATVREAEAGVRDDAYCDTLLGNDNDRIEWKQRATVHVWDLEKGKEWPNDETPIKDARALAFSPTENIALLWTRHDSLVRYNLDNGSTQQICDKVTERPPGPNIVFSNDGRLIASSGVPATVAGNSAGFAIWDIEKGKLLPLPDSGKGYPSGCGYMHFTADAKRLFVWSGEGILWDAQTGVQVFRFGRPAWTNRVPSVSPDGRFLLGEPRGRNGDKRIGSEQILAWEAALPEGRPVTGKLTYHGQPVADAIVTFVGVTTSALGRTDAGGNFMLRTKIGEKVPPGDYRVTVAHGSTKLPAKYNDLTTAMLTATVTESGDNHIELSLTD